MARLSRAHRRVSYRARVSLAEPGGRVRIAGQALNLSVTGMFVRAAGSCPLGSDVLCDMPLPGGACQIKGRITRIHRLPDSTGMAIQFVDLPANEQVLLTEVVDRSRQPSIPIAVRFEGMMEPVQCRGVFLDDKLRLRTPLPFLRVGSDVQVSVEASHHKLAATAEIAGTLSSVDLRSSPIDGVPRLAIDLDVGRPEPGDDHASSGPTPLERAIADCVSQTAPSNTPTPLPLPLPPGPANDGAAFERRAPVTVSGELAPRPGSSAAARPASTNDASGAIGPRPQTGAVEPTSAPPPGSPAGTPEPRALADEWAETAAIPAARRRQPDGQRAPARPLSAALLLAGVVCLLLGGVVFRAERPPGRSTTASPVEPPPAVAATLPPLVAPTIVSLSARPPVAEAPARDPGAGRAELPFAAGRTATHARGVARRFHPPSPLAFDPSTRQYRLNGVAMLDLGGAKLSGLSALAGAATANLRGIDVAVEAGTTSLHVTFRAPEPDGAYGVTVTPSWPTVAAISEKTAQGFTVTFAAPAPESATLDWLLVH